VGYKLAYSDHLYRSAEIQYGSLNTGNTQTEIGNEYISVSCKRKSKNYVHVFEFGLLNGAVIKNAKRNQKLEIKDGGHQTGNAYTCSYLMR